MRCIGGPKHGVDVKCDGPYFEMPVSDRVQRLSAENRLANGGGTADGVLSGMKGGQSSAMESTLTCS